MNCLKCGKEVGSAQVFCDDCLQVMDNYPVEPGTPVHIPPREPVPQSRAPRRRSSGYADSMRALRKVIRWLCFTLAVLTLIICVLSACLFHTLNKYSEEPTIGKNYTAVETYIQP